MKYASLFPSDTGNAAKPLRMALGALSIQTNFQYADRELVEQIMENLHLQYFIGVPGYQKEAPFDAGIPVYIRFPQDASLLNEARRNWKQLFTVSVNCMTCRCQDVTRGGLRKIILHLPNVKNTVQKRSGKHYASSLVTESTCLTEAAERF